MRKLKRFTDDEIALLSKNPNVKYVERNRLVMTYEFNLKLYGVWVKKQYCND